MVAEVGEHGLEIDKPESDVLLSRAPREMRHLLHAGFGWVVEHTSARDPLRPFVCAVLDALS